MCAVYVQAVVLLLLVSGTASAQTTYGLIEGAITDVTVELSGFAKMTRRAVKVGVGEAVAASIGLRAKNDSTAASPRFLGLSAIVLRPACGVRVIF